MNKDLSDLDLFALDFIKILQKFTDYVIVSGYVSILLGRARASEDIDIIIPKLGAQIFNKFLIEVQNAGFYCLNAEKPADIYNYLEEGFAVRYAKHNTVIPNIELKFAKKESDNLALEKRILTKIGDNKLYISHLELQIAFKEIVLKSPKDMEDARHLRNIAEGHLNHALIKKYELMLHDF